VRGGIPLCWPWFGDHPNDSSLPAHGFARTSQFELTGIKSSDNGETLITLRLENSDAHHNLWPHPFVLDVDISVGDKLSVSMTMTNHSPETLAFTSALHSYFNISDVKTSIIQGLDGAAAMGDFNDDGYQNMVCVETSNALTDSISLGSGESHTISTYISAESTL